MKYKLVIFDLDGTLLNTLKDIAVALNHSLATAGYSARTLDEVRAAIGGGVGRLVRLSMPKDTPDAVYQKILADFRAYYSANLNVHTSPYEGIHELLKDLKDSGIHIAANSNKVDDAVALLCRAHFDTLFEMTLGERKDIPKKPAPDGPQMIMRALSIPPSDTLYVGDSETDVETAMNAGIDSAWVSWGYRNREELGNMNPPHAFDTVSALKEFILNA